MIKKISIIACMLLGVVTAQAQHKVVSFFDELRISYHRYALQAELPALLPDQV